MVFKWFMPFTLYKKGRINKVSTKKRRKREKVGEKRLTEWKISTMRLVVRRPLHPGFRFVLLVCLSRAAGSGTAGSVVGITANWDKNLYYGWLSDAIDAESIGPVTVSGSSTAGPRIFLISFNLFPTTFYTVALFLFHASNQKRATLLKKKEKEREKRPI